MSAAKVKKKASRTSAKKGSSKAGSAKKKSAKKSPAKKVAGKKTASKKTTTKKKTSKPTDKKTTDKKTTDKKTVGKKAVGKKSAVKKPASKKSVGKKAPPKKESPKSSAKKSAAKKSTAKVAAKVAAKTPVGKGRLGDAPASTPVKQYDFKERDAVVYPRHGVGQVVKIETATINNKKIKLLAVSFEGDRMIMRIPFDRASETGLRPIASRGVMNKVMTILAGKARVRRTMWSRRAQEYTNKIQSGDVIAIGEVVRELWRDPAQPEQSFSERQMYQHALSRLAREYGAVYKISEEAAVVRLEAVMQKSPKTAPKPAEAKKSEAKK